MVHHLQKLSEEEQKLFRLYGKLPNKKDLLQNKLKERKYFDSGDYAMSKAGKADASLVGGLGREHPSYDSLSRPPRCAYLHFVVPRTYHTSHHSRTTRNQPPARLVLAPQGSTQPRVKVIRAAR